MTDEPSGRWVAVGSAAMVVGLVVLTVKRAPEPEAFVLGALAAVLAVVTAVVLRWPPTGGVD